MHELLASLNEKQRVAVETVDGPVLILAGAGSGKTKTLIHRMAYIIATGKAKPWNILGVTFTNKAAKEIKERLKGLLGADTDSLPITGTFHSICAQILRREITALGYEGNFVIYDSKDQESLIKKCMKDLGYDTKQIAPKNIGYMISAAKNDLLAPADYEPTASELMERTAAQVYNSYQRELHLNNALDFDDLIRLTAKLFKEHPEVLEKYQKAFTYIMVDEYQDTNHAQYTLVAMLAKAHRNICVVGDDFQSIYSWRGANLQNILDFEDDYEDATVVLLEQNYRSSKRILEAANEIIKYNTNQKDKVLWTDNDRGHKITIKEARDERDEGEYMIREVFDMNATSQLGTTTTDEITYVDEDMAAEQDAEQNAKDSGSVLDKVMASASFKDYQTDVNLADEIRRQLISKQRDLSNYVVLYRTNAQSRALEEVCMKYNVPYRLIGGIRFYERKEIKDIVAYIRVLANPKDWVSLERIYNTPARSLGANSWAKIEAACRELGVSFLDIIEADLPNLRAPQHKAFMEFQHMMLTVIGKLPQLTPAEAVELLLDTVKYTKQYDDKLKEDQRRIENIEELASVTRRFDNYTGAEGLTAFLEDVALISDQDEVDENAAAITLMTVHASKGLEFDTVFMAGMEEGLFPHSRSLLQPEEMEEERRLCYVAITRAKRKAYLMYAAQRTVYGSTQISAPSRFIDDLPEPLIVRE